MKVAGRKVAMFRCHQAPLIGPKVNLAHVPRDLGWEVHILDTENGIHIKTDKGEEHVIGITNIEAMRLEPEAKKVLKKSEAV